MRRYQVISADGHVETTSLDYTKYIASKFLDKAPRLVQHEDGTEWWHMEEWEAQNAGNLYCGAKFDDFVKPTAASYHFPDGTNRPGTGDATQRLREQDMDGIDAEVLYPPVSGPRFWRNMLEKDRDAYVAIHQAYNSFLADYSSVARDRLITNCTVPETGVDDAIAEMKRCKEMGLISMCLANWPNGGPTPAPEDDRFWAAALDLEMKISPHVNFGGGPSLTGQGTGVSAESAVTGTMVNQGPVLTIGRMMTNGVFDRFPKLMFYFAETNAGWLPFLFNFMDEFYMRWYKYHNIGLKKMPSQYYRDHCKFSFIQDRMAMKYRHDIGVDLLMWGSDFPHSVGTFPDSREILSELFEDVPEAERRKVLVENVCEFFDLDPEKELTATP